MNLNIKFVKHCLYLKSLTIIIFLICMALLNPMVYTYLILAFLERKNFQI